MRGRFASVMWSSNCCIFLLHILPYFTMFFFKIWIFMPFWFFFIYTTCTCALTYFESEPICCGILILLSHNFFQPSWVQFHHLADVCSIPISTTSSNEIRTIISYYTVQIFVIWYLIQETCLCMFCISLWFVKFVFIGFPTEITLCVKQ